MQHQPPWKGSRKDTRFGCPLGQVNRLPVDREITGKLYLRRCPIDSDGCAPDGVYWGIGLPLYCSFGEISDEVVEIWFRAANREVAKLEVQKMLPNVKFYR